MSMPETLSSDPQKRAEYNRFINNISTIYGSQNASGIIPVFWTKPAGYGYAPDSESTLRTLSPKESYYFIVRDESSLPLNVPFVSGLLPGLTDANKLPTVSFSGNKLLRKKPNYSYLEFPVKGLQPYEDYAFRFNHIHANWPCTINPLSGVFKPSESEYTVAAVLEFCAINNTHTNDSHPLPYVLDSHGIDYSNLYNIFNIEVYPLIDNTDTIMSDSITMHCDECVDPTPVPPAPPSNPSTNPVIQLPESIELISYDQASIKRNKLQARIDAMYAKMDGLDPLNEKYQISYDKYNNIVQQLSTELANVRDGRFCTFKAKIFNLNPNDTYNFRYNSIDGNWPAVVITPPLGTISKESSYEILTTVAFAACSGAYGAGTQGYLDYHNTSKFDKNNVYTMINLSVSRVDGNTNYSNSSKPLSIYCKDCLSS
jgi:hypothetical protein